MSITIFLADDHHVVREGLRLILSSEPDFSVVGEAADGQEVLPLVERLEPRVLLLDVVMPNLNGLEVTRQVTERCPKTRTLLLSMHANEAYVLQALRNGAAGYVLKESSATMVVQAVREVAEGRRFLSSSLSQRAIDAYLEKAAAAALPDLYDGLTEREREVLALAAEGHTTSEIAERLFISPRTVETHRAHVMRKLELKSQTDLIRYALRRGILPMDV